MTAKNDIIKSNFKLMEQNESEDKIMIGCGVVVALFMGAVGGVVLGWLTGSVVIGFVAFIICTIYAFYQAILGIGDANRATQHIRDQEIIDAIHDLKDRE